MELGYRSYCVNSLILVRIIITFSSHIFHQNIPKIPQKPIVILTKSIFSRTPKCHVFPTFSEMSRSDVGFTDGDSVTA